MMNSTEAKRILESADLICSEHEVTSSIARMAGEINEQLADSFPLVLAIMGGAVVFSGHLLPQLRFPLEFDYIHVSRYGDETQGGRITWKVEPRENVAGRTVLVLDDILDEGATLAEVKRRILGAGAKAFYSAVFSNKDLGREKPIKPDFVGLTLPNRFVFGFGMDVSGAWRNLPAIYAVRGA
jgi:hypoxanthine phosphoribosyltransferase